MQCYETLCSLPKSEGVGEVKEAARRPQVSEHAAMLIRACTWEKFAKIPLK